MRKIGLASGLCLFFLIMFGGFAYSQEIAINEKGEIIQQTPDGAINWSEGIISAVGYASPDQEMYAQKVAAAANARANLLTVLGDLSIKRGITVKSRRLAEDINIQNIEGILHGSFVGTAKRQPDGTLAVAAYKRITPQLLSELLPAKYFGLEPGDAEYTPKPAAPKPAPVTRPYTGLIIDAGGLGVIPSLGFRVMVEETKEVLYGLSSVSRMTVIEKGGMAGYARSVKDAEKNPRIGENPLVVKASKASGQRKTDIYISREAAANIYSANLETSFLKDLKVVIICGG